MYSRLVTSIAALLVSFAFSGVSHAAVIDYIGTFANGDTASFSNQTAPGTQEDDYLFELTQSASIEVSISEVVLPDFFNIDDDTFSLQLFDDDTDLAIGSAVFSVDGEIAFAVSGLAAGDYYLRVTSTSTGSSGGLYAGAIAVVPLPPALVLFGSGLVTLLLFGRIKRRAA